ncbi:MAG: response regulator [Alphaproteobacteria bacterium]|nr:response regulator [Alphaproteobacteria bacterium]
MRRAILFCVVYAGTIMLPLIGLNHYVYTTLRQAAIAEETSDIERQGEIRAQEIENSLLSVQFALEKIELLWQQHGGDAKMMHDALKRLEEQLVYVRAIGVSDGTGKGLFSSRAYPTPAYNVANTESFQRLRNDPGLRVLFTGPSRNSIDGNWQINLNLAVRDADGRLKGVIGAILDPRAYEKSFESVVADGDYVTLLNHDFVMIARSPWREQDIGKQIRADLYEALRMSDQREHSGVFTNIFTGEARIAVARRLFGDQLVLSTSRSLEHGIDNWRSLATIISAISLLVMLSGIVALAIGLLVLADRESRARMLAVLNIDLQEQTARAEKLATVKSEFLATMSHEIRTPMNGVLGMAQALENMPLDATTRDYVGVIRESAESLLGIINDILDYSRLEAGKMKVAPSAIRLRTLMDSMSALFASACAQKKLSLRVEIDPDAPTGIESDPVRLRQILVNLVGNAVKFTSQGHVTLRVRPVTLGNGVAGVRFEIEDTGPGISQAALNSIFERFSQEDASTSRRFGGTGLGLAICRRLCQLLGGEIDCKSEQGRGSLFWFEIPAELGEEEDIPLQLVPANTDYRSRRPRVLCVDDNHVNRRVVETLLKSLCEKLVMVDSGAAALLAAEHEDFDVVLLDIHMPDMDGIETHRRLRGLLRGRQQRIIALTADVVPEALARYEVAGFDAILAKPIELDRLLAAIGLPVPRKA